jgi:hypothetical protein
MEENMKEENQVELAKNEVGEDATKYGEFIPSQFAWVSLPDQKEIVDRLQKITKKGEKKSKTKKN